MDMEGRVTLAADQATYGAAVTVANQDACAELLPLG